VSSAVPLQRRGPSFAYASRIAVPLRLRSIVKRREIVRSLATRSFNEAQHRLRLWEGHVHRLFRLLLSPDMPADIDALVNAFLSAELDAIDRRLATGAWKTNHHVPEGWNDFSQSLLADELREIEDPLAHNFITDQNGDPIHARDRDHHGVAV
jgi:hypothetical protein